MSILTLKRFRTIESPRALEVSVHACRFERALLHGSLMVGGVLTCIEAGRERTLQVAMTWDALAQLRAELARQAACVPDEVIIARVLRHWGVQEYKRRLANGACLPQEGLLLSDLGGPCSARPRGLLQACKLLPLEAA